MTLTQAKIGGLTRISNGYHFGQIKHEGKNWAAEIRACGTGSLVRFAGLWPTKRDAAEEIEFLLSKPEHRS